MQLIRDTPTLIIVHVRMLTLPCCLKNGANLEYSLEPRTPNVSFNEFMKYMC